MLQVALLFVDKALAVRHQQSQVTHLRPVDGGVVDLVDNPVRGRPPDLARGRIRRPDNRLLARRPPRLQTRRTRRLAVPIEPPVHPVILAHSPLPAPHILTPRRRVPQELYRKFTMRLRRESTSSGYKNGHHDQIDLGIITTGAKRSGGICCSAVQPNVCFAWCLRLVSRRHALRP